MPAPTARTPRERSLGSTPGLHPTGKRRRNGGASEASTWSSNDDSAPTTSGQQDASQADSIQAKLCSLRWLEERRERDAAQRLQLEKDRDHLDEQHSVLQSQILELEAYESDATQSAALALDDLRTQLRTYDELHRAKVAALRELDQRFAQAVAQLLELPEGDALASEMSHQQRLQELQMQRIALEGQLERLVMQQACKLPSNKKARTSEAVNRVWDWLADSDAEHGGGGVEGQQQQQQCKGQLDVGGHAPMDTVA